jgi:anti-sigma factor NepR-like protein
VTTVTQRRGWDLNSVAKERKTDREKNRAIRTRQRAIGRELRRMFDDVVKEPVPNELLDLLKLIDEQGEGGDTSS